MIRTAVRACGAGVLICFAATALAKADEISFDVVAKRGERLVLGRPHTISRECDVRFPVVEILDPGEFGQVRVEQARFRAGDVVHGRIAGNEEKPVCGGLMVEGPEIFYETSVSEGRDHVEVRLVNPQSQGPTMTLVFNIDIGAE